MERHAVPQNIMEVEFKLFGSFTVRQFGYLAGGFVISLLIYFMALPGVLKIILIVFFSVMGLILALVRVNGQEAAVFVKNYIMAMFVSQERVWKKTAVTPDVLRDVQNGAKAIDNQIIAKVKKASFSLSRMPLASLSTNEPRSKVDEIEENRLKQIDEYFEHEIKGINTSSVRREEVKPPTINLYPQVKNTPPIVNTDKQNIAGQIKVYDNKVMPGSEGEQMATITRPLNTLQANRPMQIPTETTNPKSNLQNLQAQISQLQSQVEQIQNQETDDPVQTTNLNGNTIAGFVVSNQEQPIASALVSFKDLKGNLVRKVSTDNAGKFTIKNPLPSASYFVDIESQSFKFNRYKVILMGDKLFSFKFKSK